MALGAARPTALCRSLVAGLPDRGPDIDDDVVLKLLVDEVVEVLVFVCRLARLRCAVAGTGTGLGATWLASTDGSAAALVASLLLSLVQLGACLRDRPLELLERRREVRTRQLLERLGGVVAVRRPTLGPELLA